MIGVQWVSVQNKNNLFVDLVTTFKPSTLKVTFDVDIIGFGKMWNLNIIMKILNIINKFANCLMECTMPVIKIHTENG